MRCTNHYLTGRLRLAFLPPQSKVTNLRMSAQWLALQTPAPGWPGYPLISSYRLVLSFPTQSAHRHLSTHGSAPSPAPDSSRSSISKHSQGRGNNPAVLPCGPWEWGSGKRQMGDSRFHVTWGKKIASSRRPFRTKSLKELKIRQVKRGRDWKPHFT